MDQPLLLCHAFPLSSSMPAGRWTRGSSQGAQAHLQHYAEAPAGVCNRRTAPLHTSPQVRLQVLAGLERPHNSCRMLAWLLLKTFDSKLPIKFKTGYLTIC